MNEPHLQAAKEIARLKATVARQTDLIAILYSRLGRGPDAVERDFLGEPSDEELAERRAQLDTLLRDTSLEPVDEK